MNLEVESLENEQINRIIEEQNILVENNENEDDDEAENFDEGYNNENEHIPIFVDEQPNKSIILDIYDPRT